MSEALLQRQLQAAAATQPASGGDSAALFNKNTQLAPALRHRIDVLHQKQRGQENVRAALRKVAEDRLPAEFAEEVAAARKTAAELVGLTRHATRQRAAKKRRAAGGIKDARKTQSPATKKKQKVKK